MSEKEKMLSGKLYKAQGEELAKMFKKARRLTQEFNRTDYDEEERRKDIIRELFLSTGENFLINIPFRCDYGCHISIGENFYSNMDCIILDVNHVKIGDNVMFGPRVSIYTAGHPVDKDIRGEGLEFGLPVVIRNDVWIGGDVVINPGVTIGNGVVIGSGSVVVHNIPDLCIAVGNPCRVLRKITEEDQIYWQQRKKADRE